jgi:ribosomal protein L11 methyltransferase
MAFIEIKINNVAEEQQDVLIAKLAHIDFEAFEQTENSVAAYINATMFDKQLLEELIQNEGVAFETKVIEYENWNALWESSFSPVLVDNFVAIRASFHKPITTTKHEIVITPKMSFGTGHHATTYSVMQIMELLNFDNKTVLDFGTGTGILAILAEILGAKSIVAIDYDDWCIENATENVQQNKCKKIEIIKASTAKLDQKFDIVIANINKNIIIDNLKNLDDCCNNNSLIVLSGLLIEDEVDIVNATKKINWQHQKTIVNGAWIAILLQKIN